MSEENSTAQDSPSQDEKRMHWYVAHVFSGREKRVVKALQERIVLSNLQDSFGEIIVPTETVVAMKGGEKKSNERKFFPGYVLISMELTDQTWHLVRQVPDVMGFVGGTSDRPVPISKHEVDRILQRVEEGFSQPRPMTLFEVGEVVRVIEGAFADFDGVVESVNYEKSRMKVSVMIFGRSTSVELEFSQVEKI